ncbi:unnamed protein product [Adineta steineri]|uniref:EF-hand domain-containing protein n=1 Tax=Adineta steineri TaxID=433720 RepID=A0A814I664_9BILA|nr:unnamed protein product [Adineta steineri]CAF1018829.1 unnamed protein product [Adineta steineri]
MTSLSDDQLEKEFDKIDKSKDKTITVEELRKYYVPMQKMLGMSPQLAEVEIDGLIKRLDTNHDGNITFEGKINILFF